MSSAVSNIIPNPLSHKHDGSPHSLSTLSSSPACGSNFSPNQTNFSQPHCGVAAATTTSTNSNGNGYNVYGVSPTEGSTASGICSGNNGPMSNVENSLTGNIDNNSIKMKENDFYIPDEQLMQMSTNISNHDPSIPSTPAVVHNEQKLLEEEDDEDDSRNNMPPQQQMPPQHPMQMQIPPFDQITYARKPLYPINPATDRNVVGRLPYAYNRPNIPYPYPIPDGMHPAMALNRSNVYPPMIPMQYMMPQRFMHPHMGMIPPGALPPGVMPPGMMPQMPPMPPPNPAPPPPQPKPKSRSRKQNNNNNNNNNQQQQQQQQSQLPPQMSMMPPLMRAPPDMMRASSSGMGPPDIAMHQNIKINGSLKSSVKRYPGNKTTDNGMCHICTQQITQIDKGLVCTALNQGCMKSYHPRCQNMSDDCLIVIGRNENIEWVCRGCTTKHLIWNVDS